MRLLASGGNSVKALQQSGCNGAIRRYIPRTFKSGVSMFITPAFAQANGSPGMGDLFGMVVPLVMIMVVFWFLLIRPQQRKAKEHQELLKKIARGDTVITHGGLIGKVVKIVDDNELQVEVGDNVKVRVLRSGISDVRAKGEPVKDVKK
jgi:preprotein translocase subunit YajC